MFGDRLPATRKGKPIRASVLNRAARGAENLMRGRISRWQTQLAGIPLAAPAEPAVPRIWKAKADHGAINHGTAGTLTLYESLTSTTLTADTIEATNVLTASNVPSGTAVVWVLEQDGEFVVLGWECP